MYEWVSVYDLIKVRGDYSVFSSLDRSATVEIVKSFKTVSKKSRSYVVGFLGEAEPKVGSLSPCLYAPLPLYRASLKALQLGRLWW